MASIPLPFTAVQDRVAIPMADVAVYLGISVPGPGDTFDALEALIEEAHQEGDRFLNNPFLESDNSTDAPIPNAVRQGVLQYIAAEWAGYQPGAGAGGGSGPLPSGAMTKEKVGDVEISYASPSAGAGASVSASDAPGLLAAKPRWIRYRLQPGHKRRRGL